VLGPPLPHTGPPSLRKALLSETRPPQRVGHGAVHRCIIPPIAAALAPIAGRIAPAALAAALTTGETARITLAPTVLRAPALSTAIPAARAAGIVASTGTAAALTTGPLAAFRFTGAGFVVEPQRQTDPLPRNIDLEHLHLDH